MRKNTEIMDVEIPTKPLVQRLIDPLSEKERAAVVDWGRHLLTIKKDGRRSVFAKVKEGIRVTASSPATFPLVKALWSLVVEQVWMNRGAPVKAGLVATVVTLLTFGGQGAGIAALGTAIGVPLWVIFGAGATFIMAIIDEINKRP